MQWLHHCSCWLQRLGREQAASLVICSFLSLHFLTQGTASAPRSHSQSHSCCCYFIPKDSRRDPEQTGIKPESLAVVMSIHTAGNSPAPSGVSGQSQMCLHLSSHCLCNDSYPKATRRWSLWHGCSLLAF